MSYQENTQVQFIRQRIAKMKVNKDGTVHRNNGKRLAQFLKYLVSIDLTKADICEILSPVSPDQILEVQKRYISHFNLGLN